MPTSTLSNLLHRHPRVRGHKIRGLTSSGSRNFCKGRKFATLVYDLDRARVLWVGSGKGRDTIDRLVEPQSACRLGQLDMSPDIGAITHHCPKVTLVSTDLVN